MKKMSLLALTLFALCGMQPSFADSPATDTTKWEEEEEVAADEQESSLSEETTTDSSASDNSKS